MRTKISSVPGKRKAHRESLANQSQRWSRNIQPGLIELSDDDLMQTQRY